MVEEEDEFGGEKPGDGERFDLPTVSRSSGLPERTINEWEGKYGAIDPTVSEDGVKSYGRGDVDRLSLLKALVGQGHVIAEIAALPIGDLRIFLGDTGGDGGRGRGGKKARLIVVGDLITSLLSESGGLEGSELVRFFPDLGSWLESSENPEAELILADCPTLFPESVVAIRERIESAGATRAVLVYQFLRTETLEAMEDHAGRISAMRAPITGKELKAACEADLAMASIRGVSLQGDPPIEEPIPEVDSSIPGPVDGEETIPPPQFSDSQLSRFSQISTAINCECPHHLAALLSALNAFEHYSRDCENRNAEDAALHAFLYRRTARARSIMEDALAVLAEVEGIEIR